MIELTIDPEFRTLIPPLTGEEQAQLEANLLAEGCRDPLVVWAGEPPADAAHRCQVAWVRQLPLGTMLEQVSWLCPACGETRQQPYVLLDGYHRDEICQKHGLTFTIMEASTMVKTREDARIWIIQNQFARRNLEPYQRAELALKLEALIAVKAKANQQQAGGAVPQKLAEAVDTRKTLAKMAGISHETMRKAKVIAQEADEATKEMLRRGKRKIHGVYQGLRGPRSALNGKAVAEVSATTLGGPTAMEPGLRIPMTERLIELAGAILEALASWRQQYPQDSVVGAFPLMEKHLRELQSFFAKKQREISERFTSVEIPPTGTTGQ